MVNFAKMSAWTPLDMNVAHKNNTKTTGQIASKLCSRDKVAAEHISKPGRLEKMWDKLCGRISVVFTAKYNGPHLGSQTTVAEDEATNLERVCSSKNRKLPDWLGGEAFDAPEVTKKELSEPRRLLEKPTAPADKKAQNVFSTLSRFLPSFR